MDMYIKSLHISKVDDFINPSTDLFGRIDRCESEFDHTVDLLINVNSVTITENTIAIRYPNDAVVAICCPSRFYHKIEVL